MKSSVIEITVAPRSTTATADAMPGSELQVFEGAGHFPFHTHPGEVLRALRTFLAGTAPAHWSAAEWRELLRHGRED